MYLQLALLSMCATGAGAYYCITNEIIRKEDIESCLEKIDNKVIKLETNAKKFFTTTKIKFNNLINELFENEHIEQQHMEKVDIEELETVELITSLHTNPPHSILKSNTPSPSPSISSPSLSIKSKEELNSTDEFILLYD